MHYSIKSYEDKIRNLAGALWEKHGEAAQEKLSVQIWGLESADLHHEAMTCKLIREEIRRLSLPGPDTP